MITVNYTETEIDKLEKEVFATVADRSILPSPPSYEYIIVEKPPSPSIRNCHEIELRESGYPRSVAKRVASELFEEEKNKVAQRNADNRAKAKAKYDAELKAYYAELKKFA